MCRLDSNELFLTMPKALQESRTRHLAQSHDILCLFRKEQVYPLIKYALKRSMPTAVRVPYARGFRPFCIRGVAVTDIWSPVTRPASRTSERLDRALWVSLIVSKIFLGRVGIPDLLCRYLKAHRFISAKLVFRVVQAPHVMGLAPSIDTWRRQAVRSAGRAGFGTLFTIVGLPNVPAELSRVLCVHVASPESGVGFVVEGCRRRRGILPEVISNRPPFAKNDLW